MHSMWIYSNVNKLLIRCFSDIYISQFGIINQRELVRIYKSELVLFA